MLVLWLSRLDQSVKDMLFLVYKYTILRNIKVLFCTLYQRDRISYGIKHLYSVPKIDILQSVLCM